MSTELEQMLRGGMERFTRDVRLSQGLALKAERHRQKRRMTARAAAIAYPFLGVADERARQLTWCKVDPSPVSNGPQEVPVSPRCRS